MRRGAAPGERRGGRGKGSLNKRTIERLAVEKAIARPNFDTRHKLETLASYWLGKMAKEQNDAIREKRPENIKLLDMFSEHAERVLRDLMPYDHPKLAQTTLRTDPEQPIVTRLEIELVSSRKSKDGAS